MHHCAKCGCGFPILCCSYGRQFSNDANRRLFTNDSIRSTRSESNQSQCRMLIDWYNLARISFRFVFKGDVVANQSNTWRNLTAVRAAFIVAGWIIVSIHIKNDRLSTMIKNTEEKAFYEELQFEQNTIPLVAGVTSA